MSHGFMGLGAKGLMYIGLAGGFSYYLSRSFTGPNAPKYQVDPAIALMAKETQPGIVPEHYFKRKEATN